MAIGLAMSSRSSLTMEPMTGNNKTQQSSRKRPLFLRSAAVLLLCHSLSSSHRTVVCAFAPQLSLLTTSRLSSRTSSRTTLILSDTASTSSSQNRNDGRQNGRNNNTGKRRYLLGQHEKKEASEIKMREAEELGGIPRSDRYSSSDWWHNTMSLPSSAILRAIRGPVFFMTLWAAILSIIHRRLVLTNPGAAELMSIPLAPHSLMVSALSLLLVFKTNSAYQRFAEGRKIWETIINNARDLYRMMNLYEREMGRTKRRRLQRLLAAFPYLLRHRIRPNLVMYRLDDEENVRDPEYSIVLYQDKAGNDLDPEAAAVATQEENEGKSRRKPRPLYWVDKRTLPWRLLPPNALEPCARAQNRPLWVCDRMACEIRNIPDGPNFTARERLALISKVEKLSGSIGACERIHQTVVPLNYARHSLRALTLFLFTLPFCLVQPLKLLTAPALFLISWLMFGIYEIGYSIEDPFQGTLRLSVLCDAIRRDVLADEVIRSTAFEPSEDDDQKEATDGTVGDRSNANGDEQVDYEFSPIVKQTKPPIQFEGLSEIPITDESIVATSFNATLPDFMRKKP
ncbi:bestrophin, RFP-TM, chloride channel [Nitzschia inconspicua]|uniref:Bestrophin, RFP-TM, chloride channel n=1 Tax=Nitzschia inconspicua TaxID=303405 RepID=A0A9K3LVM9_9STRA|nr:bestrophin, RFP-TM, chloride channel [Nitzschia inconspicua]